MSKASVEPSGMFPSERPNPWTVRALDPLPLGGDPAVTTDAIAWLRDATARFTRVVWSARITGPVEVGGLVHLHPPEFVDGPAGLGETWRDGHRYGSYHYRLGPSFIVVKDTRRASTAARLVIDEPELREVFLRCVTPMRGGALTAPQREAAGVLVDEGLLLDAAGWLVTLPLHMTRWPVHAHDI